MTAAAETPNAPAIPRAGVIGWPIAHSRSPLIHGHWLKTLGLPGSYTRIPVPPDDVVAFLKALPTSGLAGCNVTVPHKEAAYASADRLDAIARAIGAVNTLWIERGQVFATNTDGPGFLANLDDRVPGWDKPAGTALVLGAGGAARAVVWGLLQRGFTVRIANRTLARAADLVERFGSDTSAHGLDEAARLARDADLIVNTTTLGMSGDAALPLDFATVKATAIAADIVYVPLETPFLKAAAARGLRTADGLGMLLHQAVVGFEHWFGRRPVVTEDLRRLVLADLGVGA